MHSSEIFLLLGQIPRAQLCNRFQPGCITQPLHLHDEAGGELGPGCPKRAAFPGEEQTNRAHRCLVSPRHANTGLRTRCEWKETAARFVFLKEKNNQNQPWMKNPTANNMAFCIPAGSCEARKTRCSLEWTTESCQRAAAEEPLGPAFPLISPLRSVLPLLGLLLAVHFFPSLLP